MAFKRSEIQAIREPNHFWWATGIEDTFITAPWPKTGRTLDEYELTGHYDKWKEDIGLMQELGLRTVRYGIPWHRIQPNRGSWVWDFADKTLNHLLECGIDPIVDLVHYGLPPWIEGAYLNKDFPLYMAEYAAKVAERYRGRIYYFTPLNEPRVTAWYCGKLGWWPPFLRGWRGFLEVMFGVCRGISQTIQALHQVDPEITAVHVDATDLYEAEEPELEEEAQRRQEIVFLALDLIAGRVESVHPLYEWLLRWGITDEDLLWFQDSPVDIDVIGINLYPMFSLKKLSRRSGSLRLKMPYADANIVTRLGHLYYSRYNCPLFISETASVGSVRKRQRWLDDSIAAVRTLRQEGVPMMGYTWWPLFALVTWGYRQGNHPPDYYLKQMGLWDIKSEGGDLKRVATKLVDSYKRLAESGVERVGILEERELHVT